MLPRISVTNFLSKFCRHCLNSMLSVTVFWFASTILPQTAVNQQRCCSGVWLDLYLYLSLFRWLISWLPQVVQLNFYQLWLLLKNNYIFTTGILGLNLALVHGYVSTFMCVFLFIRQLVVEWSPLQVLPSVWGFNLLGAGRRAEPNLWSFKKNKLHGWGE